jgi:hypothetical protein
MATLARGYGLSPVAQALGVNYTALKRHLVASPAPKPSRAGTLPPGFVEVPVATWPSGPQWVIELEDRRGSKLTLRLAQSDSVAALALAQGLWRHRS